MSPATQHKYPTHPLKSIKFQNILSFGPGGMELDLKPLNVLIGPNASGKSNLIEVLNLVRSMPTDPHAVITRGGGVREWGWKGSRKNPHEVDMPHIELALEGPEGLGALQYSFGMRVTESPPLFLEERLQDAAGVEACRTHFAVHDFDHVTVRDEDKYEIDTNYSILTQFKDPVLYPEITYVGRLLPMFRLYRDWQFGPSAEIRRPQRGNQEKDFLAEDASNLALVFENLEQHGVKQVLLERLQEVYGDLRDVSVQRPAGFVVFLVHEQSVKSPVPPERVSDGTIRYLCLACVLCHPTPPPVVCIEEPELGLHPDALSSVAKMLIDASSRCQLIVTTHSPELIDALSETPESVVVCERTDAGTQMTRLDPERLQKWLQRYRLGELWQKGEIGGTRW